MKLKIVIRKIDEKIYLASCPTLKGCHVESESEEAAHEAIQRAIKAYVVSHKQRHEKIDYQEVS